jgi:hypothetical protein
MTRGNRGRGVVIWGGCKSAISVPKGTGRICLYKTVSFYQLQWLSIFQGELSVLHLARVQNPFGREALSLRWRTKILAAWILGSSTQSEHQMGCVGESGNLGSIWKEMFHVEHFALPDHFGGDGISTGRPTRR